MRCAALAAQDGVTHIVATPHANYEYRYDRALRTSSGLKSSAPAFREMTFSLGCDFHLSYENIADAMKHPERMRSGNTRYLLVELSEFSVFDIPKTLFQLQTSGPGGDPHPSGAQSGHSEESSSCLHQILRRRLSGPDYGQLAYRFLGKSSQKICAPSCSRKRWFTSSRAMLTAWRSRNPRLSQARDAAAKIIGQAAAEKVGHENNPGAVVTNQVTELITML